MRTISEAKLKSGDTLYLYELYPNSDCACFELCVERYVDGEAVEIYYVRTLDVATQIFKTLLELDKLCY